MHILTLKGKGKRLFLIMLTFTNVAFFLSYNLRIYGAATVFTGGDFYFYFFFADFGMSAEVTEHGAPVSSKNTVPLTVYSCPLLSSGRGPRTMPRQLLNVSKDRDAISRGT